MSVPLVDLREVSDGDRSCVTVVRIGSRVSDLYEPWIWTGRCCLIKHDYIGRWDWTLTSFLVDGATDVEHHLAIALRLPLVDVRLLDVSSGTVNLTGIVEPCDDRQMFGVPPPGYDPFSVEGVELCTECDPPHRILPEGFDSPPFDSALYELVRGRRVLIHIRQP